LFDPLGVDRPEAEQHGFGVLVGVGADGQEPLGGCAPGCVVRGPAAVGNRGGDGEECSEKHHGQCHHRPSSVTCYSLHGKPPIFFAPHSAAWTTNLLWYASRHNPALFHSSATHSHAAVCADLPS